MSGEEGLSEEQRRREGMSGSVRGRRSEKLTQLNLPPHGGQKYLLSSRRGVAVEVPHNEEISGGGKNGGRKGVDAAIRQTRAIRGSINIKERMLGGVV